MGLRNWLGLSPRSAMVDPGGELLDLQHTILSNAVDDLSVEELWRDQPQLRTVVSFLARNVAQLGLHVLAADSVEGRVRVRDHPVARLLARPNEHQTTYEMVFALVSDLALYDRAYLLLNQTGDGWDLRSLPAAWVTNQSGGDPWGPAKYTVQAPGETAVSVPSENVIAWHGWSPTTMKNGSPAVLALRDTLREQVEASRYRTALWERGGRVGAVVTRPKDAPDWAPEAERRFKEQLRNGYARGGGNAGSTMLLKDGMDLKRVGFSAKEEDFVDVAKLSLQTVASVFHVNPTMVGLLDNANYSNVREFRRMLYGDTLAPIIRQLEGRLNAALLPRMDADDEGLYVEFNMSEKLRGSFEEQASVMAASVGGPWMTRNEARSRENLPSVDGGDELIVPLNLGTTDSAGADEPADTDGGGESS